MCKESKSKSKSTYFCKLEINLDAKSILASAKDGWALKKLTWESWWKSETHFDRNWKYYVFAQNGKSVEMQNQYWRALKTDERSKSWHGRVGGKDHYWLSHGASRRLMEESHQNTPENEI